MVRNVLKSVFALFFLNKIMFVNGIVVTPTHPKKNDQVILAANASGLTTVTWQKNNSILTSCYLQAGICGDETILPGANIKIDQMTNITTIKIASANQSFYGGVYTASGSTNVNLIINTLPASMNWTTQPQGNLTTVSSATWTAKIYCVYPTSSVKVDFKVFVEGIKDVSSRSLALSNETDPSCDAPEQTIVASLTLSSSEFINKKVYIIANASHASFPNEPSVTTGHSVETTFQGDHTSTSAPITKPPQDELCFAGNGCSIGTTLVIVIPIVTLVLIVAGCSIYHYRKKTNTQEDDKLKSSGKSCDLSNSTTMEANGKYDNQSRFTNHNENGKYSTTDKTISDSYLSMNNIKQEGNRLSDGHNNDSKSKKNDESANSSDNDQIKSKFAAIQAQCGVSEKTLHESTVSSNTKQGGSVCNNYQTNSSKKENKNEFDPSVTSSAGIQSHFVHNDKTLYESSVASNKTKKDEQVVNTKTEEKDG